jgi:hypothetical protein
LLQRTTRFALILETRGQEPQRIRAVAAVLYLFGYSEGLSHLGIIQVAHESSKYVYLPFAVIQCPS